VRKQKFASPISVFPPNQEPVFPREKPASLPTTAVPSNAMKNPKPVFLLMDVQRIQNAVRERLATQAAEPVNPKTGVNVLLRTVQMAHATLKRDCVTKAPKGLHTCAWIVQPMKTAAPLGNVFPSEG